MLGAIAGDIIGSVYEARPVRRKDFALFSPRSTFTDDTVLTVAVADVLLNGGGYAAAFKRWFRRHPGRGFGGTFHAWAASADMAPYGSFGNGAAMRVSPAGWAHDTLDEVLAEAARSAAATHDHPEGVKGAQATAAAVFLARTGHGRDAIRAYVEKTFGYDLHRTLDAIRPGYRFDVSCQGSVPESIICFLESGGYEDAVRNAVSLGGDSDTMACIAGGIAEAFYGGVPDAVGDEAQRRLDGDLLAVVTAFRARFGVP
ncbi:MAG: ADP-ribosylglycohydrolase family protein [Pseudomonadota bacterium]|nr:ADP-ribosylglycohydrolase family protein [Pseudomonadota bacterium]